jgi:cytochrome o ubiquinol oxidase subunit IV
MSELKRLAKTEPSGYANYVVGFILSLVCTLSAYFMVTNHYLSNKWALAGLVGALALIQFIVQITLFLHLGKEKSPRFKLLVFAFMLTVVLILVGGSIWIMYNLNYRMMSPNQINKYMNAQDGGL